MLTICVLRSVFIPVIRKAVIRVHVVIRRGYHLPLSQPSITAVPERRATGWLSALRQCPIRTEGARSGGAESLLTLSLPLRAGRREIRPAYFRDDASHALASGRYRHRGLPLSGPSASVVTVFPSSSSSAFVIAAVIPKRRPPVAITPSSPSARPSVIKPRRYRYRLLSSLSPCFRCYRYRPSSASPVR